jgi:hypothetical protein
VSGPRETGRFRPGGESDPLSQRGALGLQSGTRGARRGHLTRIQRPTHGVKQKRSFHVLTNTDFRRAGGRKRGCLIWDARHFVRPAGREPPDSDPHRGGRGTDSVGLAPERAANPENCARSRNEVSGGTSRWPRKGLARVRPLSHAPTRLLSCPGRPDGAISTGTPADLESAVAPRPSHGARATPVANRPRDRSPLTRHRRAGDQRYHT